MVSAVGLFATLMAVVQTPASDSLLQRAKATGASAALVVDVRARPDAAREALATAMAHIAETPSGPSDASRVARDLAAAWALAWRDSFLVREVERFLERSPAQRARRLRADSLRRAGVTAWSREGPGAALAVWRAALAVARSIPDSTSLAGIMDNIGAAHVALGALDSAARYLDVARGVAHAIGDVRVEANALGHLGDLSADQGDPAAARARYVEATALRRRSGDTRGEAADLNNSGLVSETLGDRDEARRFFEQALVINRRERRDASAASNLVNLAGLSSLDGKYGEASAYYEDALATWRAREEWAEAAVALLGLGQLEVRRGDYPAAVASLRDAVTILDRTGPVDDALQARRALADAVAAMGDLQGAIDVLADAAAVGDSSGASAGGRAAIALARADLAVRLNALAQADALYQRAAQLYRSVDDASGEATAQSGWALLLLERDEAQRAEQLLLAAQRAHLAAGEARAAALTGLSRAQVARQRGDTAEARRMIAAVARDLARLGDPIAVAAALGEHAALEAEAGAPARAEAVYRTALQSIESYAAPSVRWQLLAGLGMARRARGDNDGAARELRAAIAELEHAAHSLTLPERRAAFLADKWDVYVQLALTERDRGLTGAALDVSEQLRAREMLEQMSLGRVASPAGGSNDLVGREQDLRRRIGELASAVEASAGPDERGGLEMSRAAPGAREALQRAQSEYGDLLLQLRERVPRHARYVAPRAAAWRDVARRLLPDQALVTYLVSDSGSLAFLVLRDTVVAVDLPVRHRELIGLIDFARGMLTMRRSEPGSRVPWQRLHASLITPLEQTGLLSGVRRLVIVPHAELHYLPFAALVDSDPAGAVLGARYELSIAPSASVWLALADRGARRTGSGTLAYAPRPDALPASWREVSSIDRMSRGPVLTRIGPGATEAAFRAEAPTRRILHLATYGILNRHNPLFSRVELAPGDGQDGRLEVHEVMGLSLVADLVVLAACQTALGSGARADVPPGDDWVGLTRAFLEAGATRVVASLWPVDDWATAALMEQFYDGLAQGLAPSRALSQAQRALRRQQATADPFYWAGFVVVGGADQAEQ